jgi:PAS domain S-box-containing protein
MLNHIIKNDERSQLISLYDLAPVGYFILDYRGVITDVNHRGVDFLKLPKGEVLNKRFQSFIPPESWEVFYNFLHRTENNVDRQTAEIKLYLNGYETAYVRIEGIAVHHTSAIKINYYIAVIDITAIRKSQINLQEIKDRLEMTLMASSTGIWTFNTKENKVYLDSHSYAILKIDQSGYNGSLKKLYQYIHPKDRKKVREMLIQRIKNDDEIDIDFRLASPFGEHLKYICMKGHEVNNPKEYGKCYAGILLDVTERNRMASETENLRKNQQRLILSASLVAQEKERAKISAALHDSVCQILYGIRLNLQSFQLTNNIKDEFVNINQLLDQAIRETRQISYELTPSVLKDFGFAAGIKEMAERLSTPNFVIRSFIESPADQFSPQVQLYLFRIIQELINNTIKHAKATAAEIRVIFENNLVNIVISDNGVGFDTAEIKVFKKGSGLRGIINRVFLFDGDIDFVSNSNGTTITLTFSKDINLSIN